MEFIFWWHHDEEKTFYLVFSSFFVVDESVSLHHNTSHILRQNENSQGFSFLFWSKCIVFLKIYDYSKIFHIFMTNYCECIRAIYG